MYFNITQCSFFNSTATKTRGGIHFIVAYATIHECIFINNITKTPKTEKGGDIYYQSSEKKPTAIKSFLYKSVISNEVQK